MKKNNIKFFNETLYEETLENGMKVYIIPNDNVLDTFVTFTAKYGGCNYEFKYNNKFVKLPNGVAHFLEHKMFEQKNRVEPFTFFGRTGTYSNAATNYHNTYYIFAGNNNFKENLNYLLDFVQDPYFTDENVEKEKGIIGQEIMMYDDYPEWKVYLNAMEAMYHEHPVKLDITGTIETISHIDKSILYKCYNTFYNPSNMAMVVCGDFEPEELLEEIKKRLIYKKANGEIKRIYPEEKEEIVKEKIEQNMDVSQPLFAIGIKDKLVDTKERVRKHIAIEILLNIIIGKSSKLYKELYDEGILFATPGLDYEFARGYAHILITGQSPKPEEVFAKFKDTIETMKKSPINSEEFNRIKKRIYGEYVKEYNDVADIARMFLADFFKEINSFDYLEEINTVDEQYAEQILKEIFDDKKMIISVIKKA